ncbi:MAG TPA: pyridoxal phosphate-dependent aminotransferase [Polyangia bacterium]|nr:pyridoxal phosphate-dependent aminotransferase [Polyangia bacterium]
MHAGFSSRLPWDRGENGLAVAERERRARGAPILDLTESNPTRVGVLPSEHGARVAEALAAADGDVYEPAPRGLPEARAAVAAVAGIDAERVVLTASSSESCALLFKILCDPGDAVLVPEPSYPLFDSLARLEGVVPVPYRLAWDGAWHVDFASVDGALAHAPRPRAIVVVHPNNPTGSFLASGELAPLAARCEAHGLAVVSDEVFAGYASRPDGGRVPSLAVAPALTSRVLTFALGGLSKSCAMPQLKLGWIAVAGPDALVDAALARLELAADTYLSVGGPVQRALPRLLAIGADARRAVIERVATNRAALAAAIPAGSPCSLLPSDGGWSAILRVPATRTDEDWARALLEDDGVLVHPGYFFDLRGGTFVVVSLLPAPDVFADGAARLVARAMASSLER